MHEHPASRTPETPHPTLSPLPRGEGERAVGVHEHPASRTPETPHPTLSPLPRGEGERAVGVHEHPASRTPETPHPTLSPLLRGEGERAVGVHEHPASRTPETPHPTLSPLPRGEGERAVGVHEHPASRTPETPHPTLSPLLRGEGERAVGVRQSSSERALRWIRPKFSRPAVRLPSPRGPPWGEGRVRGGRHRAGFALKMSLILNCKLWAPSPAWRASRSRRQPTEILRAGPGPAGRPHPGGGRAGPAAVRLRVHGRDELRAGGPGRQPLMLGGTLDAGTLLVFLVVSAGSPASSPSCRWPCCCSGPPSGPCAGSRTCSPRSPSPRSPARARRPPSPGSTSRSTA